MAKFAEIVKAEVQLLRIYILRMSKNSDGQRAACVLLPGTPITNERTAKVSDYPNSSSPGSTGSVRYINPDSLNKNPAFTNVVVVEGNVKTVHIGGQVEVIGMAPVEECEHDMFVEMAWDDEGLAIPLSQLEVVDADDETREAVED